MTAPLDIAIAGAGPAGLAAALYLYRAGHRVTIFERFGEPSPVGSGLILQPTGLTVLADLGLLDAILALGSRIERLHGVDAASGRTVLDVRYDALPGGRFGLGVHRAALFGVLYRAVCEAGIAIETGVELDALETGERICMACGGRNIGPFDLVVEPRVRARSCVGMLPNQLNRGRSSTALSGRRLDGARGLTNMHSPSDMTAPR